MSNSPRIGLPYLDAAQAQKHVTMNEALARLDVVAGARVETMALASAPVTPSEGEAHLVPAGASGDWAGQGGSVAVFLNGGWDFIVPWFGWRLWVASISGDVIYDGTDWQIVSQPTTPGGALTALRQIEFDHVIAAGTTSETAAIIPDKAIVLGVTGRVIAAITGAASWSLGVGGSPDRYGAGFGVGANAFVHGVTGSPQAYFGATTLLLTSVGGDFAGGTVRFSVHFLNIAPARPI